MAFSCNHVDSVKCPSCGTGWYDKDGVWPSNLTWPTILPPNTDQEALRYINRRYADHGPTELTALREHVDGLREELQAAHELRKAAEQGWDRASAALEIATAQRDQAWSELRDAKLQLAAKSRFWKWAHR